MPDTYVSPLTNFPLDIDTQVVDNLFIVRFRDYNHWVQGPNCTVYTRSGTLGQLTGSFSAQKCKL